MEGNQVQGGLSKRLVGSSADGLYVEYGGLKSDPEVVNFCFGSPDMAIPDFMLPALAEGANNPDCHQYQRPGGSKRLVEQIASQYSPLMNREIDPLKEVIVTGGASGAFCTTLEVFLKPGDEIVYFEPFYSYYILMMKQYQGVKITPVNLFEHREPEEYLGKLKEAFTPKTKIFLLNTPHNPTGKVFTKEELTKIADLIKENCPNAIVFADSVYSNMTFEGRSHVEIASLPGMWERTITSYSFGKIFGATGWRVGMTVGPEHLIDPLIRYQEYTEVCHSGPIWNAVELVLKRAKEPYRGESSYYEWLAKFYEERYHLMKDILKNASINFELTEVQGGYFFLVNIEKAAVGLPVKYFYSDFLTNDHEGRTLEAEQNWRDLNSIDYSLDYAFMNYLAMEFKVLAYPISMFCDDALSPAKEKRITNCIRFPLCKSDETFSKLRKNLCKEKKE